METGPTRQIGVDRGAAHEICLESEELHIWGLDTYTGGASTGVASSANLEPAALTDEEPCEAIVVLIGVEHDIRVSP